MTHSLPPSKPSPTGGQSWLGVADSISLEEASLLSDELGRIWHAQLKTPGVKKPHQLLMGSMGLADLAQDLSYLRQWFDPVASGKRLRGLLENLPRTESPLLAKAPMTYEVGDGLFLVTPEGRACHWLIHNHLDPSDTYVWLTGPTRSAVERLVVETYREWTRHRIDNVAGLLQTETATLRPTAAGLLLMLLVNRNIGFDNRLPVLPPGPLTDRLTNALSGPILAFGSALSATESATLKGIDLYRGWAVGEVARRLGKHLHRSSDGLWLDENGERQALSRLAEGLVSQDATGRTARIPQALRAFKDAYEISRPELTALGLAHERPNHTNSILQTLERKSASALERRDES